MLKRYSLWLLTVVMGVWWVLSGFGPKGRGNVTVQEQRWVDSVYQTLTPDQRLGQLFMVAAYSNKSQSHVREIEHLITQYGIGGVMFMQGGPVRQAHLTNRYQSISKVPLLVAIDAEWGLDMRLDSSMHFAKQMTLGALPDDHYVYLMGREIALKLKRMGIHVNFSPVVDVNSNPKNPVIGNRSFGENKEKVTARSIAYIKGLQDHGIIAVAKHFPGHGDTDADSHFSLPVLTHDMARLTEVELYPFKRSFDAGVMGVMVAHLHVPKLDSIANRAATLSPYLVNNLLKGQMQYEGLVFTDALNMKGVTRYHKPGEVDALALKAGNDVLLFSEDVPKAIATIKKALADSTITEREIEVSVRKMLHAKYWAGLNQYSPVDVKNLSQDLSRPVSQVLQQQLYEQAATVVVNKQDLLPFRVLDTTEFASVAVGASLNNTLTQTLDKYAPFRKFAVTSRTAPDSVYAGILRNLAGIDVVVVSLHNLTNNPNNNFNLSGNALGFIRTLQRDPSKKVVVVVMGNAYSLKNFENSNWLVCGYEDNEVSRKVIPQILFGALPAIGRLPVTASPKFKAGDGITTPSLSRLKYSLPESVGMNSTTLKKIDNIALEAIAYAATPGCQVLVVKDGTVVLEKAYGFYTYDRSQPVTEKTIYDLASITKVAATLQAVMFLKDQGQLKLDEKLVTYLPELKGSNKANLTVRDVLLHQAGLVAFIPFWTKTFKDGKLNPLYYDSLPSEAYPNLVVPGVYSNNRLEDSVWKWVVKSDLVGKRVANGKFEYRYSDLGLHLMKRVAERLLNQPLPDFLAQNFYAPLGASTLTYNPLDKFLKEQIAPTAPGSQFKADVPLQGTVHDGNAALLGGKAGHAGLFSNANDLAILMQMDLQNGNYGGQQYFKGPVVTEFSQNGSKISRRGLGWDKPEPEGNGPTSDLAPLSTFGHTGFTGTGAWIDPENNIIYIFLSNRVYPDSENDKLLKYNIRTRIHDVVYQSLVPNP
ncbi:glycoside hydrolase family 3 N-terminal domain-containing protein [Rufibacter glacialis]|uniref:beta-N-acetylhexosaminidase n=1 Tax=Rufibacter glacialis TaxID=1259555 RepID=A0A5M8QKH9_9BACT|nr:glycoside hydrolase family 3 N-terminal domain-containing protein [Rufibacter glacialis]KAA6435748.1 serine hydrolase [Rufibacter glacialis]GGK66154.1 beta-N-acetylglucosaminidase [Rufibacter glacialis]